MSSQVTPNKCSYNNCTRDAICYFTTTKKWCCEKNAKACPANKLAQESTIIERYGCKNVSLNRLVNEKQKSSLLLADQSSIAAKRKKTCIEKYGTENVSKADSVNTKRNKTFIDTYGSHPLSVQSVIDKKKTTMLKRYGVDNYGKTQEHKDFVRDYNNNQTEEAVREVVGKILHTKMLAGLITGPKSKNEFERYYVDVRNLSDRNYKKHKSTINPYNFSRGRTLYHLDHIFSIKDGFENSVPVDIVSHYTNLRMLKYDENIAKGGLSDKTLAKLFEDYRNS